MARNRHCDTGRLIRDTSSSLYLMESQSLKQRVNDESFISSLTLFFQWLLFGPLESWCLFVSCDKCCHMTFDKSVQNRFNKLGHGLFSALFFPPPPLRYYDTMKTKARVKERLCEAYSHMIWTNTLKVFVKLQLSCPRTVYISKQRRFTWPHFQMKTSNKAPNDHC